MRIKMLASIYVVFSLLFLSDYLLAAPQEDLVKFREYFKKRFPNVEFSQYKDGNYAISKSRREIWQDMEDVTPTYITAVEPGN